MKNKVKSFLALLLSVTMVSGVLPGKTEVHAANQISVVKENNSITIGNEYISREFSMTDHKLKTDHITNKRTDNGNTVFTPADGSEEFIVKLTKSEVPALDRTDWVATADSYQNATGASDGAGQNLLDGDTTSIWHTNYGGGQGNQSYPYNVLITTGGKEVTFNCFSYTPRQGSATNGDIKGYELWAATSDSNLTADATEWKKIASGDFTYDDKNPIYVNLEETCTANQLKFVATSSNNGLAFAGGAEFNLHPDKYEATSGNLSFASSDLTLSGDPVVEDTTATINDVKKTGKKITFKFEPYTFKGVEFTITENIVMYEGDHFMRKYMEISIPDDKKETMAIDYIDLESLKVNDSDVTWTIPTDAGGIVEMEQFKANLGQPIYIQGMFFGCEFPATDTEIVDGTGYMRYYTGKTFKQFENDNQLTKDGKYVTWQTVAGAARSTEQQVVQADFFEYIESIATPTDFRIQYNSWFDNMMLISDENILESFIEMDKELNKVETRPLDSYVVDDGWINYNDTHVVDANRAGTTLNKTGFWEFNSKFPNGLTTSSDLVHKFGSNFGVWVGPRGGYNFYSSLADILTKSGKGSKAGNSIDVADRNYLNNLTEMFVKWQKEYGVNYWKWDGFADRAQYNAFPATDGVPGYANNHMTGGYHNMYHVTDLWEGWIDVFEAVRQSEKEDGVENLWLSLTCYTIPSPWFLQWANSVWIQCTHDQNDAGSSSSKMDRQLTYRDACYYDFLKNHEFQFPLSHIYNHDPVYGVEGTGMNINTATDEQFQNYLYMMSTRGTAFWELYFSDSIMTEGKYEVTSEFLAWAEENYHMLRNAKMFGSSPNTGTALGGSSNGTQNAYGFSCFDGNDGIISVRNAATTEKSVTMTFDRTIGVPENAGTLKYYMEHSHNLTAGTTTTGTFEYGKEYTFTLQPDEVRIFRVSKDGDTTAPEYTRAYVDGDTTITLKFNEKVTGQLFNVEGAKISSIQKSADDVTYHITLAEALEDGTTVKVTAKDIKDLSGNALKENTVEFVYNAGNEILNTPVSEQKTVAEADKALASNNGFTVQATVEKAAQGVCVSQGNEYLLGINEEGKAFFTLNGVTATSTTVVKDGAKITGVKENNGILKLYIDGTLEGSAYKEENRFYTVKADAIKAGGTSFGTTTVKVYDIALGYDELDGRTTSEDESTNLAKGQTVTAAWTADGSNAAKGGDRPMTMVVDGTKNNSNYGEFGADNQDASSYMQLDLGKVSSIESLNLFRYWNDGRTYKNTVVAIAEKEADFASGNATIVYNTDTANIHGLGQGSDATYAETENGKSFVLDQPVNGRYVRVYMNGTTSGGTTNHVVELEVIGKQLKETIDITELLTRVIELKAMNTEGYSAASVAEFNTLVEEAYELIQTGATTQEQVTAMLDRLENAEQILVKCDHKNVTVTGKTDATCVTPGTTGKAVCDDCGAVVYESTEIPAKGHSFGDWTTVTEATCEGKGSEKHVCGTCNHEETREVAAKGHDYSAWETVTEPTEEKEGLKKHVCKTCNHEETEVIAKLEPTPVEKPEAKEEDKQAAQEYLDACVGYYTKDNFQTEEEWAAYQDAVKALEEVLAKDNLTADELQAAIDALESSVPEVTEPSEPTEPEQPNTEEPSDKDDKQDSVQTGDAASVMMWVVLFAIAMAVVVMKKKRAR